MDIKKVKIDERREALIFHSSEEASYFVAKQIVEKAQHSQQKAFAIALSGGSTPKNVYKELCSSPLAKEMPWKKTYLFWSDERAVTPTDSESNYRMAMEAGFNQVSIPPHQVFRMQAEEIEELNEKAALYEKQITEVTHDQGFNFMLLGMGEDGHTASLFPGSRGVKLYDKNVIANYIPQKKCWRMTLTVPCINHSQNIFILAFGETKAQMVQNILKPDGIQKRYPAGLIGTTKQKSLWILDKFSAAKLIK